MKKENMRSEGAVLRSSAQKRLRLISVAAVLLICCLAFVGVVGAADFSGSGTEDSPYEISSVDDFKKLATNVNAGNTYSGTYFKLMNSLNLNNDEWTPIGNKDNPFKGSFDGDNKEIQNLKISSGNYVGLFGYTLGGIALKNISIKNVEITGGQYVGALVGNAYTVGSIENCHISGTIKLEGTHHVGGITGSSYASPIKECSVIGDTASYVKGKFIETDSEGDKIGGLIGQSQEGSFVIEDCHTNIAVSGTRSIGGLLGFASYGNSIIDCSATGSVKLVYVDVATYYETLAGKGRQITAGGLVGESNPSSSQKVSVTSSTSDSTLEVDAQFAQNDIQSMVSLGLLGGVRGDVANVEMSESSYSVSAATLQTLKDAGYAVLDVDGSVSPMLAGEGTTDSPFEISNVAELKSMRDAINSGGKITGDGNVAVAAMGACYKLTSDIDLGGETWTPIASFNGQFDGNGKIISNFHIDATEKNGGFFSYISWANIHDLTLEDVTATVGNKRFGTLISQMVGGSVYNIVIKNVVVTTTNPSAWVSGLISYEECYSQNTMKNCNVENLNVDATAGAEFIAGIANTIQKNGDNTAGTNILDNLVVNGFKVTVSDSDGCGVGGLFTQTQTGWQNPRIINSGVTGIDITASGLVEVGGFIAWPGAHTIAENCYTEGKIDVTGVTGADNFAGGFFGNLGWNADLGQMGHKVTDCTADVDITTGGAPAGGFVGSATNSNDASMYAIFTDCVAEGDVTNTNGPAGGFAGDADRGVYSGCTATGAVSGTTYAGGFIGYIKDTTMIYDHRYKEGTRDYLADCITLTSCTATGTVTGPVGKSGPLVGGIDSNKPEGELSFNYTITFNTNGGTEICPLSVEEGTAPTAPAVPSRDGYTFGGWSPAIPRQMPSYDITVNAVWNGVSYTVSFDAQGGTPEPSVLSVTFGSSYANLPNVEKTNYYFSHWKDENDNVIVNETLVNIAEDHTLTAVWLSYYNITFDTVGGSDIAQMKVPEGTTVHAPANPTKEGYTFKGWENLPEIMPSYDITVKAIWEKTPVDNGKPNRVTTTTTVTKSAYQVVFYPNGGNGDMDAVTFVEGEQKALPVNTFTREGYTFKGWALTSGGEVFYTDGESVLIDGTTSLYAVWEDVTSENPETPSDEPTEPETPETPAPLLSVLAGLGAAVLLRRK